MFESAIPSVAIASALIFLARVFDVSIGTLRIISVSKGRKYFAPLLGFVEILIWLFAIRQVIYNPQHIYFYFAYAAGFACGNFVGLIMEERLALGWNAIRIITNAERAESLIDRLKERGFGFTAVEGEGSKEPVKILYVVARRKETRDIQRLILEAVPKAFYSIDEIQSARSGIFPRDRGLPLTGAFDYLRMRRKAK